jgi:hypothetical protein
MPSRWERLTSVTPKIDADRMFLIFVAARYRGEPLLPRPRDLAPPVTLRIRTFAALAACLAAVVLVLGLMAQSAASILGAALMACALGVFVVVEVREGPSIRHYHQLRARAVEAQSRLQADRLSTEDADTLNEMIRCDEGTLSYCAAKIASEIERDPAWGGSSVGFVQIDLWQELADVGASAYRIAEDRIATEQLEQGRLRDDDDVRVMIAEDKDQRREALAALAARVHAFADYRDRIQRVSAQEVRDRSSLERATLLVSDEQARYRLT